MSLTMTLAPNLATAAYIVAAGPFTLTAMAAPSSRIRSERRLG